MTLAGEVTKGLQNRHIKNNQVPTAMNDGCFTNGASHNLMNDVARVCGDTEKLVSLCLSHCANKAA